MIRNRMACAIVALDMPTPKRQVVIDKVVSHLSPNEGVAALVLVGSNVEGSAFSPDQFSDIEMYVVADDEYFQQVEEAVKNLHQIFDNVVLEYKNQWAGWSILFNDLLRLEIPTVKASDESVFSRSDKQKTKVLYSKPGFELQRSEIKEDEPLSIEEQVTQAIKDFWYMAVYAAQHIARGELWLARDAVRISMQGKVKRLLQEIYLPGTLELDRDRRIELTWNEESLRILRETSCTYEKQDIVRAFWANVGYMKMLLSKLPMDTSEFEQYEQKLVPEIKAMLEN